MKRALSAVMLLACGAPQTATSVTITSPSARPQPRATCPLQPNDVMGRDCRDVGLTCRYPDMTCICRRVPYCPGGVVRTGPPPPDVTVEFECMLPECAAAAEGGACAHEGVACRAAACYTRLTCTSGKWKLVDLGPPP